MSLISSFVRPSAIVNCSIVICVSIDWLQTTYRAVKGLQGKVPSLGIEVSSVKDKQKSLVEKNSTFVDNHIKELQVSVEK